MLARLLCSAEPTPNARRVGAANGGAGGCGIQDAGCGKHGGVYDAQEVSAKVGQAHESGADVGGE
jgi:hypothetical protein